MVVACNCSVAGSLNLQCNATGYCDCKANVDGIQCDQCSEGFFNLDAGNSEGCEGDVMPGCVVDWQSCHVFGFYVACLCNSFGSVNESCTDSGDCFCNPGVIGQKCDQCAVSACLDDYLTKLLQTVNMLVCCRVISS